MTLAEGLEIGMEKGLGSLLLVVGRWRGQSDRGVAGWYDCSCPGQNNIIDPNLGFILEFYLERCGIAYPRQRQPPLIA